MNVFEKLNLARIQFQQANKKMSGWNDYSKYNYYELSDILPEVNMICNNIKAVCIVRYEKDMAFLDFVDCEKPDDKITFTSPMSEANLKGCHAVQNLGAVETYVKRYLYQACFEIVENDALDGTMNPNQKQNQPTPQNQQSQQNNTGKELFDLGKEVSNLLHAQNDSGYPVFGDAESEEWKAASNEKYKAKDVDGLKEIVSQLKNIIDKRLGQAQAQMIAGTFGGQVQ